ncbi:unnamed protein product [Moneuplotes crassus]|uniref:Uncharacterized protein n=2 Tax=Euplotes crassus TaxID=5936 RepID=A0AAD1YDD4_EUPCR|nr:unnamed protein product [Moneuplotes crassus]
MEPLNSEYHKDGDDIELQDIKFERLNNSEIAKESERFESFKDDSRYCLNAPDGHYYYAHVDDKSDSLCEGKLQKLEKRRKELDQFLMRAVDSIDFSYEFEQDPSLRFNFHRRGYLICLIIVSFGLIASYISYLNINNIIQEAISVGKLTDSDKIKSIIQVIIYFDSSIMIFVLGTGLVAQYTIKTSIFKMHSILLVCSILTIIPLSYLSEIYLIVFTSRMLCYIYCRYLISIIYNSLVYPIFTSIEDDHQRTRAIERFNNFIKFGQARVLQNYTSRSQEQFSISQRIFRI